MDTNTTPTIPTTPTEQPVQQLSLLPSPDVPLQFRLDAETRRRGLRHIAQIRKILADRQTTNDTIHHTIIGTPRQAA